MYDRDPGSGSSKDFYHNTETSSNQATHIGKVVEFYKNNHRADVALLQFIDHRTGKPIILRHVQVAVNIGGKNWGEFRGLRRGQLVQVQLDHGSWLNAQVTKVLYTGTEPAPRHPMILEDEGHVMAYALQMPINDDKTPGNLEYYGADGTRAQIVLGKNLKESSGTEAERTSGPSISAPEHRLNEGKASLELSKRQMAEVKKSTQALANIATGVSQIKKKLEALSGRSDSVST